MKHTANILNLVLVPPLCMLLLSCATSRDRNYSELKLKNSGFVATKVWDAKTGSSDSDDHLVADFDNEDILVMNRNGKLYRFDSGSGDRISVVKMDTGAPFSSDVELISEKKIIIAGNQNGEIFAWDFLGKLIWNTSLTGEILSPPVANNEMVFVRSGDGRLHGLDVDSGEVIWSHQVMLPSLTLRANPKLVLEDEILVVGMPGGKLLSIDASNGAIRWEVIINQPAGANEIERLSGILGTPFVSSDKVCAASYNGRVACYRKDTGELIWARQGSSSVSVEAAHGKVFYCSVNGEVFAHDIETGQSVWAQNKLMNRVLSAPKVLGKFLAVGDQDGVVYFLATETGKLVTSVSTDGTAVKSDPMEINGLILVRTDSGRLHGLGLNERDSIYEDDCSGAKRVLLRCRVRKK